MGTFRLPDLGEGLAEAEILAWHVKPGDQVLADQPMISVETAKSVVEVPVPYAGTIMKLHGSVGDIVATGAPLIDFDSGTVVGSMPVTTETELVESAVAAVSRGNGAARPRALPVARAAARHLGLDLAGIRGNGHGGAITLDDVLAHASPAGSPGAAGGTLDHAVPPPELPPGAAWEPLRGLRRAMARSMSASQAEVPLATVCDDADVHGWSKPGDYMLRLVRALIGAWRIEPALNAWYDAASNGRVLFDHIDLAIAVDTPQGLIVPVVRHIENKTPEELKAAVAAQKSAAHQRSIPPEDLRGFALHALQLRDARRALRNSDRGAARGGHSGRRQGAHRRRGRRRHRGGAPAHAAVPELRSPLHHRRRGLPFSGGRDRRPRDTGLTFWDKTCTKRAPSNIEESWRP